MLAGGIDAPATDIGAPASADDSGHSNMLAGGIAAPAADIGASAAVGAPASAPIQV